MATTTFEHASRLAGCLLTSIGLAGIPGTPALAAELPDSLGTALIDGYIAPATQGFADAGAAMHASLQDYCAMREATPAGVPAGAGTSAEPTQDGRQAQKGVVAADAASQAVADRFRDLAQAWAHVEFLRFGPLVQDNRFERIFFWPDPRGTVQRRTQAALGSQDAKLLEAGVLRAASVAIQGMPSLEYALYGGSQALLGSSPPAGAPETTAPSSPLPGNALQGGSSATSTASQDDYRCAYATAVAANVATLAAEVAQAWGPEGDMAERFARPGPDNPLYRTPAEVAAEMIKALSGGVHYLRDAKLLPALGATPAEARPTRAPLSRSDATLDTISTGLRGMGQFYQAARLQAALAPADAWLATVVTNSAGHVADRLDALDMPLEQALVQAGPRETLVSTVVELSSLKEMIDGQVASALGINVGFNALDGD